MSSSDECCVCLDNYENSDCVKLNDCNHVLHSQCAWSYFVEYNHDSCPLCESDQTELKTLMLNCQ